MLVPEELEEPSLLPEELEPLALPPEDTEPWTTPMDDPPDDEMDVLELELPPDVELPPADVD